jgi:hypothetical protein
MKKAAKSAYQSHTPEKGDSNIIPESESAVETFLQIIGMIKPHKTEINLIFEQDFLYELAEEVKELAESYRAILR